MTPDAERQAGLVLGEALKRQLSPRHGHLTLAVLAFEMGHSEAAAYFMGMHLREAMTAHRYTRRP